MTVGSGLDQILARPSALRGLRLGLIANPASVTRGLEHAALALRGARALRLAALFGPEHGIWADAQDLVEVEDGRDPATGLPVFSLYGPTRKPTARMLEDLDALVFDVQDVGARYYTFVYTMLLAMEACAEHGLRFVVLDRPNPLGGRAVDGNVLDPRYLSFVGLHPLAVRHGMTPGELALLFRAERGLDVDLTVVRMRGWRREMAFEETGLPWVLPSPNMPTVDTAWWRARTCRRGAAPPGPSSWWARPGSTPGAWPPTSGARGWPAPPSGRCSSRRRSRSTRGCRAGGFRSTSPTAGGSPRSSATC
jgi:uncharacterized protein YbbC (DUF1343 family)